MPLSRTYRPQQFKDVTGQQHVTETLRKEVESGVLGHAYLFSGPRGVGKTTSARIFAKALLCEHPKKGEPDNTCDACVEVTEGRCIDLFEMDAASHTQVEKVREEIVEHVRFSPVRWKRKIYVIDEAHMLSTASWNALLKTLEEPPEYAVFVLATTELHKVPATIVSRCQRFEFKRISPADMTERLRFIADQEKVKIDDDVYAAIVRTADGYVRDAESLLEQVISLGEKKITREIAELVLPASRTPQASQILSLCADRNTSGALALARELQDQGLSASSLIDDLLTVVRSLIRCEDPNERLLLEKGDADQQAVAALIGRFSAGELGDIALMLMERRRDVKGGIEASFALELVILAISHGLLPHSPGSTPPPQPPSPAPTGAERAPTPAPTKPAPVQKDVEPAPIANPTITSVVETPVVASKVVAPPPVAVSAAGPIEINDVRMHWTRIIRIVEEHNRSLPFILKISQPESVNGTTVTIRFQYPFHREKIIDDLKTKRILESAIREVLKRDDVLVDGVVGELVGATDRPATADIVSKVLNAFGGAVVEGNIQPLE